MPTRSIAEHPVSNHGGRPSAAESEEISVRILETAQALFLRDGFTQTSMDAIASHIGISKRTLYSRHRSKSALFEAVVMNVVSTSMSRIETEDLRMGRYDLRRTLLILSERILAAATDTTFIALERVVTGEAHQFPRLAELIYQHSGQLLKQTISQLLRSAGLEDANFDRDAGIFLDIVILPPLRRAVLQQTEPGLQGVDWNALERTIEIFVRGIGATE